MAAANIDGTRYGYLPDRTLTRPFLLLQSHHAETHHGDRFNNGNGQLLAAMTAPGFRYEIKVVPPPWAGVPTHLPRL